MSKLNQAIQTRDGLKLARRQWPVSQPRGVVVLAHCIAEHSVRYEHVAAQLNGWGWSVEGYDHSGHGRLMIRHGGHSVSLHASEHELSKDDVSHLKKFVEACGIDPVRDYPL